jgi:hypothetical protein
VAHSRYECKSATSTHHLAAKSSHSRRDWAMLDLPTSLLSGPSE